MPTDEAARTAPDDGKGRCSLKAVRRFGWARRRGSLNRLLLGSGALLPLLGILGLPGSYDRVATSERVTALVISFCLFLLVSATARRRGMLWWSVLVYASLATGAATLGLVGAEWSLVSDKIPLLSNLTANLRVLIHTDPPLHPNILAGALLWPLPLMISFPFLVRDQLPQGALRRTSRLVMATGTFLVPGVFLLTQSRTAFLALAVTGALVALCFGNRRTRRVAGVVLLALFASVFFLVFDRAHRGGDEATRRVDSLEARAEIWERGLSLAAERPLLGIGMDAFSHVVHRLRPFEQGSLQSDLIAPDERIGHAHNLYLQTVLDLGIFGLCALLALLGSSLAVLRTVWRETRDPSIRCVAIALASGLVANSLFGLADAVPLGAKAGVLLWAHLGLVHALPVQNPSSE